MAVNPLFRTPYSGKRVRQVVEFLDENGEQAVGRTEQAHAADCDINVILRKYDKTGLITHVNTAAAQYGDFTEVNEYQESLNMVMQAREAFDALPADVRKEFNNDPGSFFEFATDPKNNERMVELGLAVKPPTREIPTVRILQEPEKGAE